MECLREQMPRALKPGMVSTIGLLTYINIIIFIEICSHRTAPLPFRFDLIQFFLIPTAPFLYRQRGVMSRWHNYGR